MPPPAPATILKAVILPPSRHHRPPPPFIYVKKRQNPSHPPVAAPVRIAGDARKFVNRINTAGSALILIKAPGCIRTRCWWMRSVSSGGAAPAQATGSVQQARSAGGDVEVEGGYGKKEEEEQDGPPPPGLVTLPTVLTLARVAAVPLLVSTFYMNGSWATTATTAIFVAAAITDWLDGYIARKMQLRTTFGAFLDPVADKLMVAATLVLLCTRPLDVAIYGEVPWLLTVPSIAIIGREITMSAVREWAASQDTKLLEAVAVNNLGKWKTATQMTALTILLATRDSSLTGPSILVPAGVGLLYISAGLAVWSLTVYMKKLWRILLK